MQQILETYLNVLAHLLGVELPNPSMIDESVVIVGNDLTPSDTAQLNKEFVQGFVTNIGGTSHSAIMSRSLEIAAVVGTKSVTKKLNKAIWLSLTESQVTLLLTLQKMS